MLARHSTQLRTTPRELGAITPTFYAFREREDIQMAMEMTTGGRMHFGFFRPGGLCALRAEDLVVAAPDGEHRDLVGAQELVQQRLGRAGAGEGKGDDQAEKEAEDFHARSFPVLIPRVVAGGS